MAESRIKVCAWKHMAKTILIPFTLAVGACGGGDEGPSAAKGEAGITAANYEKLAKGMTYDEVVKILGAKGDKTMESEAVGMKTSIYTWSTMTGGSIILSFTGDKLDSKTQVGL